MLTTLDGIEIFVRLTQARNVESSILVNAGGKTIALKLPQFAKAESPRLVSVLGSTMFVRPQPVKAPCRIELMPSAIVMLVTLVLVKKALVPMATTGKPLVLLGIATSPPVPLYEVSVSVPLLVENEN